MLHLLQRQFTRIAPALLNNYDIFSYPTLPLATTVGTPIVIYIWFTPCAVSLFDQRLVQLLFRLTTCFSKPRGQLI